MHSLSLYPRSVSRGSSRSYQSSSADESFRGEEGATSSGIGLSGSSAASSRRGSNCGLDRKKEAENPSASLTEKWSSSEGSLDDRLNLNGSELTVLSINPRKHSKAYNGLSEHGKLSYRSHTLWSRDDADEVIRNRRTQPGQVCFICRGQSNCLTSLSCAHRVCTLCMEALTRQAQQSNSAMWCSACNEVVSPVDGDFTRTPTRTNQLKAPRENLVGEKSKRSSGSEARFLQCHFCDTTPPALATSSCLTCLAHYCKGCLAITHPKKAPFIHHQLVDAMSEGGMLLSNESKQMHWTHHPTVELKSRVSEVERIQIDATHRLDQLLSTAKQVEVYAAKQVEKLESDCNLLIRIIQERKEQITGKLIEDKELRLRQFTKEIDKIQQDVAVYQSTLDAVMRNDDGQKSKADSDMQAVHILEQTIAAARRNETQLESIEFTKFCFDISKEKKILEQLDILRAPTAPRINDKLCSQSHDKVTLQWRSADHDHVVAYEIRYKVDDDRVESSKRIDDWMIVPNIKECHYTVHGLQSGTRYIFTVKAMNRAGLSRNDCAYIKTLGASFTFDPQSAHKKLRISNHGFTVSRDELGKKAKESGKIWSHFVSGNVEIDCGRHYWEVVVCHSTSYTIGVASVKDSKWNNCEKSDKCWCLYRLNHDWSVKHGGKDIPLVVPPPGPPKIGILLDYDSGFLTYFDGASGSHIHSFRVGKFLRPLRPVFSVGNKSLTINTALAVPDHLQIDARYC